jgi:hypothetical protein
MRDHRIELLIELLLDKALSSSKDHRGHIILAGGIK